MLISIGVFISCAVQTKAPDGKDGKDGTSVQDKKAFNVSPEEVKEIISYLASDELAGRNTGTEGIDLAAKYIEKYYATHGVKPYYDSYRDSFDAKGKAAFNVIGYIPGNDPELKNEFVVIGAHYDHIGEGKEVNGDKIANGANDNAAGTSVVMTMSKYFALKKENKRSILFVAFSAEEMGLLGSKSLAERLKKENLNLYSMINFEMIGVPLRSKTYTAYLTGYKKTNMADKMNEYAGAYLVGYLPTAKQYQLFYRSDNYPFFKEFNVPCQTLCTFDFTNFDYYHHVDDEVDQMDFNHMSNFINAFIPAVEGVVNSPKGDIVMKQEE